LILDHQMASIFSALDEIVLRDAVDTANVDPLALVDDNLEFPDEAPENPIQFVSVCASS